MSHALLEGVGGRPHHYLNASAPRRIPLFIRKTGIIADMASTVIAGSLPWWVKLIPIVEVDAGVASLAGTWLASLGVCILAIQLVMRRRYLRDSSLHIGPLFELSLYYRHVSQDLELTLSLSDNSRSFRMFCDESCSRIANVFDALLGRNDTCCSLRLNNGEVFETYGRSSNISSSREVTSEPVTVTSRIFGSVTNPTVLVDGVWVIPDIKQGIEDNVISEDANIREHDNSTGSMLVARLNAYEPKEGDSPASDDLFGILYIVSPKTDALNERHVDFMKIVACMTADAIWRIVQLSNDGLAAEGLDGE